MSRLPALRRLSLPALCALMAGSGVLHFLIPQPYRSIIPAPLRTHAAALVAGSGVAEIVCALMLAIPRTRRVGAFATTALLVAVFPANIQMAFDSRGHATISAIAIWLRLPLQIPLIVWALSFHRPRQNH